MKPKYDKRSLDQFDFDNTARGWAFCNQKMLERRLAQLEPIAQRLAKDDPRQDTFTVIKAAAEKA